MELASAMTAAILLVRVYHTDPSFATNVRAAQIDATAVLRDAGVAVAWIDCASGSETSDDRCAQPLGPFEVVVRVMESNPLEPWSPRATLGNSLVTPRSRDLPRFATVYSDRAAETADAAEVARSQVLGWAMAHEIGHLLLNNARHSNKGLMRAHWSHTELTQNRKSDWSFVTRDARGMRAAMAMRAAVAAAAAAGGNPTTASQGPQPPAPRNHS